MPAKSQAEKVAGSRTTEEYLVSQVNGYRNTESHLDHKKRIDDFDKLYRGDLTGLFPGDKVIPAIPLVENKLKNASHDLARLASEAKGVPVFLKEGEGQSHLKRAAVRAAIADTIWQQARGNRIERKLYLDEVAAGYAAISVYYNDEADYPIFMRLNPRFCYPDVHNGQLQSMLYVETMRERQAALLWPEIGLDDDPTRAGDVYIVQYFDKEKSQLAICTQKKNGQADQARIVDTWTHELGCVPVAFAMLDSADDTFHGLFDQLGGPLMLRNKIAKLMADYTESMVHAPFEAAGILNAGDEPGPTTIYQHDENYDGDTFIRRVAPAAPSGGVFGLLQYMDSQESGEAIQPPARVGVVRQSIASGSFVDSTQGTLSSAIYELQEVMAELRRQANYIAFKIEEKWLDFEKPLYRAVGNKHMYTPSEDIKGFYYHTIQYGASAGLNRAEAGARVLQDMGAGLISKELARQQIDYVDDVTVEQDRIDREQLANVVFQRFSADPNVPPSLLFTALSKMAEGKTLFEVLKDIAPQMVEYEQQQQEAAQAKLPQPAEAGAAIADNQQQAEGGGLLDLGFNPPPLQQQIIRGGFPS